MSNATTDWRGLNVSAAFCAVGLALIAACEVNPCPAGMRRDRKEERCVALDAGADVLGDADAVEKPDTSGREPDEREPSQADADLDDADVGEPALDGDLDDADVGEPALDAEAGPADGPDALPPSDAGDSSLPDAGSGDDSAVAAPGCNLASLSKFRRFQTSPAMVDAIAACGGSLATCVEAGCELASCIRERAEVEACGACVEAEARCVAQQCARDCGPLGSGDACLACSCYARCFDGPGTCGRQPVDICIGCSHDRCTPMQEPLPGGWHPQEELATGNRTALHPVALSRGLGSIETVWINDDGSLGVSRNDPSGRQAFGSAGARLDPPENAFLMNGSLAVAGWHSERAALVVRSDDNRLWHRTLEGTPSQPTWGPWSSPSQDVRLLSGDRLAIVARGPLIRDALFAGEDGNIYQVSLRADASVLENLGAPTGVRLSGPHLTARAIDLLDVVARGDDGRLYYRRMEGGRWTAWENPFGILMSGLPQIVSGTPSIAHIYWHEALPEGGGGLLKLCAWASTGWHPVVTATHAGVVSLFGEPMSFVSLYPDRTDAAGRTNANGLVTYLFIDGYYWWFWGNMGLLNLGPHAVTTVSARPDSLTHVFGTDRGAVGAVSWY